MTTPYESNDPNDALKHIRLNRESVRALRRVVLEPSRLTVYDINGDGLCVEGVGWKTEGIARLLNGLGASFDPARVGESPLSGDTKEYSIVKGDPWGHDRVM